MRSRATEGAARVARAHAWILERAPAELYMALQCTTPLRAAPALSSRFKYDTHDHQHSLDAMLRT
eukprot:5328527-Pleurochrysis_carterae.AAC.1